MEHPLEETLDLLALALPQQAVVDEDTGELVPDRAVHERRRHRRIDPAGQAAHGPGASDLLPDLLRRLLDERLHRPRSATAADVVDEVREHPVAALGVNDLRVELDAPDGPPRVADGREGGVLAGPQHLEALGQPQDAIAVTHPHHALGAAREAGEEGVLAFDLQQRAAVLVIVGLLDQAAQPMGEQLQPVTDPEHRYAEVDDAGVDVGSADVEHARRASGEDDSRWIPRAHFLELDHRGMDLAVDALLADTAGNQLGVLRSEVEDENPVALGGGGHAPGSSSEPALAGSRSSREVDRSSLRGVLAILVDPVVRGFLRDDHVVDVALLEPGR